VIGTDDSEMLALGPALLTLQPYGMATLDQGGRSLQLCGEDYARLAPPDLLRQAPCGA
jgi:hypothetical protein